MKPNQIWPDLLYVVRHGESAGNIARDAALEAGHHMIEIDVRDVDVPLSELGERQAIALGRWLGALPREEQPNIVLTSPYLRARRTAGLIVKTAGMREDSYSLIVDERFREKEFGILDRLTAAGSRINSRQSSPPPPRKVLSPTPGGGVVRCHPPVRSATG